VRVFYSTEGEEKRLGIYTENLGVYIRVCRGYHLPLATGFLQHDCWTLFTLNNLK